MIYQSRLALALNLLRAVLRKQLDVPPALADWLVEHAEEHEETSYPEPGECVDANTDPRTHLVLRQLGRDGAHRVARFLGLDEAERLAFNIKDVPDPQLKTRAALKHAIEVFENLVADSQDDAALSDDLGDAHRAEARTLAALRELFAEAQSVGARARQIERVARESYEESHVEPVWEQLSDAGREAWRDVARAKLDV